MYTRILMIPMIIIFLSGAAIAMPEKQSYKIPSEKLRKIIDRSFPPSSSVSPDGEHILQAERIIYPELKDMSKRTLELAGIRIEPESRRQQRRFFFKSLSIATTSTGEIKQIKLPAGTKFNYPQWSPSGKMFAFTSDTDRGQMLWLGDTLAATAKPLEIFLSNTIGPAFVWQNDETLLLKEINPNEGAEPIKPNVPVSPIIKESYGRQQQSVTYQNLLKDSYDEELFSYYSQSIISVYDIPSGKKNTVTKPGLYVYAEISPDKKYIFTQKLEKPFSYDVTCSFFPMRMEILDMNGKNIKTIAERPLRENIPFDSVATGPRQIQWQPTKNSVILWVEALDGGDNTKEAKLRDRIMCLEAPFTGKSYKICDLKERFEDILFFPEKKNKTGLAAVTVTNRKKRWTTTSVIEMKKDGKTVRELFSRNQKDIYNNPGSIETYCAENGQRFIIQDGDFIYLRAPGAGPDGIFPYLARLNMKTMDKEIIFQSRKDGYDRFAAFVMPDKQNLIIQKESLNEPVNYYRFDIPSKKEKQLTFFKDELKDAVKIKRELVKYKRQDGTELSGTLYLPGDWKEGDAPLPLLIWAYPLEYTDPSVAGQIRDSRYQYPILAGDSPTIYSAEGYAVLHNAAMPVIGDPDTKNNTFIEQINSSAKAAIDYLAGKKIIDRKKVVVAGHSYGAFMTANLLAHSDLFAAGIARSGAYNRTLTPFGFQDERRTFWEARDIYINMSPFTYADKIKTPLLMIHGQNDSNSGTFPIQSERLYDAIKGNGGTVKLVMLPLEEHSYRARESVMHVTAETQEWMDKYTNRKKYNNKPIP